MRLAAMRTAVAAGLALALAAACTTPTTPGPKRSATPAPTKTKGTSAPGTPNLPAGLVTRQVSGPLVTASIIGKIRLISDQGGNVISNNGGGVISNNGAGVISNNSGSIVSDHAGGIVGKIRNEQGAGIVGKIRYALGQATPTPAPVVPEYNLSEAVVEVLDAEGRLLLDATGKPITAVSDDTGAYKLDAKLPAGNLILRVRLFPTAKVPASGGQLQAILPVAAGQKAVDIDTASSLGAGYVLDRYVKSRQAIYDRLPATEAEALQRDMQAARPFLAGTPLYRPGELVDMAEQLRAKAPALDQTLERIEAILLAGQSELGDGQQATKVALSNPFGVVADVRTTPPTLYIGETGRIRRIGPDGTIQRFAGGRIDSFAAEGKALDVSLDSPGNLGIGPDGTIYCSDYVASKVFKVVDGQLTILAGTGARRQDPSGKLARETAIKGPSTIFPLADGTLWFGEFPKSRGEVARILALRPDGILDEIPGPPANDAGSLVTGMARTTDGALWVLDTYDKNDVSLWRRAPGATAWARVGAAWAAADTSRLAPGPDGALYMSLGLDHRIVRVNVDGTTTPIAGTGAPSDAGDGGPSAAAGVNEPSAMWVTPDQTMYVADFGNALIRRIKPPLDGTGIIDTVAGTRAATQQGDALALTLNTPAAVTLDPQGRVLVAEGIGGTIKRLEGQALVLAAGAGRGYSGDGGPATAARFDAPAGLAYAGADLLVVESGNHRIRKIAADGTVSTVAGNGKTGIQRTARLPAAEASIGSPIGAAVGPDGALYWADGEAHQVLRLTRDGFVEVVAGGLDGQPGDEGDGGPATAARLSFPSAVAVGKGGHVYVADTANGRIRRIRPDGVIESVAGRPFGEVMGSLLGGEPEPSGEADARAAWMLAPVALCADAAGDLYVSELGSARIATFVGALGFSLTTDTLPKRGSRIRKLTGLDTPTPRLRTIAGEGGKALAGPTTDNGLLVPLGLVADGQGRLIIADSGNNQLKLLPAGSF